MFSSASVPQLLHFSIISPKYLLSVVFGIQSESWNELWLLSYIILWHSRITFASYSFNCFCSYSDTQKTVWVYFTQGGRSSISYYRVPCYYSVQSSDFLTIIYMILELKPLKAYKLVKTYLSSCRERLPQPYLVSFSWTISWGHWIDGFPPLLWGLLLGQPTYHAETSITA